MRSVEGNLALKILVAVESLGKMKSVEGIPALIQVLRKRHPQPASFSSTGSGRSIYTRARKALVRIGKPAVSGLVELLRDPESEVRRRAVEVLREMGNEAQESVSALTELITDDDQWVRQAAAKALKNVQRQ